MPVELVHRNKHPYSIGLRVRMFCLGIDGERGVAISTVLILSALLTVLFLVGGHVGMKEGIWAVTSVGLGGLSLLFSTTADTNGGKTWWLFLAIGNFTPACIAIVRALF